MGLSAVPNWIVAKKTFPAGIRMPKRGKWFDENSERSVHRPHWFHRGSMNGVMSGDGDKLSNGDLRYWNGISHISTYGTCRYCGAVIHFAKERKTHLKEEGCGSKTTRAIRLLCRDAMCVICDIKTKKRCWGVPLCSKDCEQEWAWHERTPAALRAAFDIVDREDQKP